MRISCENARTLVPSYLDGELSEEQAAPLRSHLLDCPACRETAKEGKHLRRWFAIARQATPEIRVPRGFAARAARLAFHGVEPGPRVLASAPVTAPCLTRVPPREPERPALLSFVLALTAAAAAMLFVLALFLQKRTLPEGRGMGATPPAPIWETEEPAAESAGSTEPAREDAARHRPVESQRER